MAEFDRMECECGGAAMEAFVVRPEGAGPHPTVMMFPGATGTGPTFEKTARELASLGYLAIGINIYEKDADLDSPDKAGQLYMALLDRPEVLRARTVAWLSAVAAREDVDPARIAAIGYCFGGKCVLELARSGADLRAVVSYHGLLKTHAPAQPDQVKALVATYCAGRDPYAPMEDFEAFQKEMAAAEVDHHITLFSNAEHSFTDPDHDGIMPGISYDALSHQVSWAGTLALLDFHLS